jgi:hypothetical protein
MKKFLKFGIIGFIVLIIILVIASSGNKSKEVGEAFKQGEEQARQTLNENQTPEQKIEAKIRSSIGGKDKFGEIRVTSQINGGYGAIVNFNGEDNLSEDLIKKGIWMDMAKVYTALFKEPMDVNEAVVFAHLNTVDKYGNNADQVVMKTRLGKEEAQKVNWGQDQSMLGLQILPEVWVTETSIFK